MSIERRGLVEKEIERLHGEREVLARDWRQVPYLGLSIVLVGPFYWIWGPVVAFYTFLCVPSLVATAYYLIGVRRKETRQNIEELEAQVRRWDEAAAQPGS